MHRCLATLALLTASCSTTPAGPPLGSLVAEINAARTSHGEDLLPGDVLSVQFLGADAPWDQEAILVLDSGSASFVGVDMLPVAGKTVTELDEELTRLYTSMVKPSDLSVSITARAPRAVSLMGEVQTPGRYEFTGSLSLLEAFTMAGGPIRDTARLDQVLLIRWDPENQRQLYWVFDARVGQWLGDEPLHLQHHDVVYIPSTAAVKVNDWVDRYIRRNIPLPSLFGPAY